MICEQKLLTMNVRTWKTSRTEEENVNDVMCAVLSFVSLKTKAQRCVCLLIVSCQPEQQDRRTDTGY